MSKDSLEINANPTKAFFVEMLTRDIELDDAVLDLLDNTVDGVLRVRKGQRRTERPYEGFSAHIKFNRSEFRIEDNCGGIPPEVARDYAFRMGRLPDDKRDKGLPTVGMYGIGMKRALFKFGRSATIESHHDAGSFRVEIMPEWLKADDDWTIPATQFKSRASVRGTTIVVKNLFPTVSNMFADSSDFADQFIDRLRTHYAFIIDKGFEVTVNGRKVMAKPVRFLFSTPAKGRPGIAPYLYEVDVGSVSASLAVGFYRPNDTDEEAEAETVAKHSKETAGWTVICNDRVVLYCDKSIKTGWGEVGVPSFHPQFNAINGVLELRSNDPRDLPLTTTKRGIEMNSELYLKLKKYMREGTQLFTSYTNRWKKAKDEAKKNESLASTVTMAELRKIIPEADRKPEKKTGSALGGRKYTPILPEPERESDDVFIRFARPRKSVTKLGRALLDDAGAKPGEVGGAAFDFALKEKR